jgi:hypothetical protein
MRPVHVGVIQIGRRKRLLVGVSSAKLFGGPFRTRCFVIQHTAEMCSVNVYSVLRHGCSTWSSFDIYIYIYIYIYIFIKRGPSE